MCICRVGKIHKYRENKQFSKKQTFAESKVHGANMGPIWGHQDPGGLHIGPMNFAIWVQKDT